MSTISGLERRIKPYLDSLTTLDDLYREREIYKGFLIMRQNEIICQVMNECKDPHMFDWCRYGITPEEQIKLMIRDDDESLVIKFTIDKLVNLILSFPTVPGVARDLQSEFDAVASPRRSKRDRKQREFYYF